MRLTWRQHDVREICWGASTRLDRGRLSIEREGLIADLLTDDRLAGIDLELVRSEESCRIVPVFDLVEPRAKLDPPGGDFPGALGPVQGVGTGVTRVLRGMAVTIVDPGPIVPGRTPLIDLQSSPIEGYRAREINRYAGLQHLVVIPRPKAGVTGNDLKQVLRVAVLRAAVHLAKTVRVGAADAEQTFELGPVSQDLPRLAYVFQLHSHQVPTVPGEPLLYGDNCRHLLPTIVHPNEVLDGAIVRAYAYLAMETYGIQNHAVILDLHHRHGREVNFVGVVVYVALQQAEERDRATVMASNLVRWTLGATGAVFSKAGGGAPNVDMALVAERCEKLGVKTSLMLWDPTSGGGLQDTVLFNAPSLDAIVSIGSNGFNLALGQVDRVVAPTPELAELFRGPVTASATRDVGTVDHLGSGRFAAVLY